MTHTARAGQKMQRMRITFHSFFIIIIITIFYCTLERKASVSGTINKRQGTVNAHDVEVSPYECSGADPEGV